MSMNGNPHYENAKYVHRAPELRIIDATLALAHEQRTANLIAVFNSYTTVQVAGMDYSAAANEIRERLGFK